MTAAETIPEVKTGEKLRAPFPLFGGKARIAPYVWSRLGDTPNFIEPFLGSAAFLLARPDAHEWWDRIETCNDADGAICNVWRAIKHAPDEVAKWADNPVFECDLHARHVWLRRELPGLQPRLEADVDFFDARAAGYWVWGMSVWIGGGWCSPSGNGPWEVVDGEFIKTGNGQKRTRPHLGDAGRGVHRKLPHLGNAGVGVRRQLPHLGDAGRGVHRQLPHLGDAGMGVHRKLPRLSAAGTGVPNVCEEWAAHLRAYLRRLSDRFRRVRVCCGDWSRIMGNTVVRGGVGGKFVDADFLCGIILDPPYALEERYEGCYAVDAPGIARDVRAWCVEHGNDPRLRIALCGYRGEGHEELEDLGWEAWSWNTNGGYGNPAANGRGRANALRECVWFSPHCLPEGTSKPTSLFGEDAR